MRARLVASSLAALTALACAVPARAQQCRSVPECLAFAGLTTGKVDSLFALVTAAVAAPVILTGAVVTAAGELRARNERQVPNLALIPVPEPPPPPAEPTTEERRTREQRQRAVQLNDTLTNVGIAVGGAAVLGSIIYGIAKHK